MEAFWNHKSYDVLPIISTIFPCVKNTKPLRSIAAYFTELATVVKVIHTLKGSKTACTVRVRLQDMVLLGARGRWGLVFSYYYSNIYNKISRVKVHRHKRSFHYPQIMTVTVLAYFLLVYFLCMFYIIILIIEKFYCIYRFLPSFYGALCLMSYSTNSLWTSWCMAALIFMASLHHNCLNLSDNVRLQLFPTFSQY